MLGSHSSKHIPSSALRFRRRGPFVCRVAITLVHEVILSRSDKLGAIWTSYSSADHGNSLGLRGATGSRSSCSSAQMRQHSLRGFTFEDPIPFRLAKTTQKPLAGLVSWPSVHCEKEVGIATSNAGRLKWARLQPDQSEERTGFAPWGQ